MKYQIIFYFFLILFLLISCQRIVPRSNLDLQRGFYYQYNKLDFDKIAYSNDTSWHKEIDPLIELLHKNPNWSIKIKTFLADSSTLDFKNRLDAIVCGKINKYMQSEGIDYMRITPEAYNNVDDKHRIAYQGPNKKYKMRNFRKNTFEWEIIRVEPL